MERAFIITADSDFMKNKKKIEEDAEKQRLFVKDFMVEKGIESTKFHVGGNGLIGCPFHEGNKVNIQLSIGATENDLDKFGKQLTKPSKYHGLRTFRKNSVIAKEFADKCIKNQIVINLGYLDLRDYFKSMGWHGYQQSSFMHNEVMYMKVYSDLLSKDETPNGFIEIKLSEFFQTKEEVEKKAV